MPKTSQVTRIARALSIIAGLEKEFPPSKILKVGGKVHSRKELVALFQTQVAALERIRAARAELGTAVAQERAVARRTTKLTLALKSTIAMELGMTRATFTEFGWEFPKKRGPKTIAGKVAGAEKARATRLARAPQDG
jgi:hypothetical protein